MKQGFGKSDILLALAAVTALCIFVFLYANLYPEAGIYPEIGKEEIRSISKAFAEESGYSLNGYQSTISLKHHSDALQYVERTGSTQKANALMRDSLDVFYWDIRWKKGRVAQITVSNESINSEIEPEEGWHQFHYDLHGRPMAYEYFPDRESNPDSARVISLDEAGILIQNLLANYFEHEKKHWQIEKETLIQQKGEYEYVYTNPQPVAGQTEKLSIKINNGKVVSFKKERPLPEDYIPHESGDEVYEIVSFIAVYLMFIIVGSIFFVKRLRADLLDLKSGIVPGVLVLTGFCFTFFLPHLESVVWEMLLGFVISVPFVTGALWIVFVLGESYTRELWPEKLHTLDLMRRSRLFPGLGISLLRGLMLTCIVLGIKALFDKGAFSFGDVYFTFGEVSINYWASPAPSLYALGMGMLNSFYIVVTYALFFTAFLRGKIKKTWLLVTVITLFFAFVSLPLPKLMPFPARMAGNALIGLIIILFYLKYDFLTICTGSLMLPVAYYGIASLGAKTPFLALHALILLILIALLLLAAVFALTRKDVETEALVYVPDYVQRIYERERIQRELEIARHVQLNFLPHATPALKTLNVASICVPAREVGGDYYDFIDLGHNRLGIAIGDVSGKGIPAAFYMTLTKGFLRSQARNVLSPRQVLIHMNELFYENAERDMFISMIYGVFDLEAQTLTVARAGHNPLILKRSGETASQDITPAGLALGLESGDLFAQTLEEHTLGISPGDVFLFYTDGLNEAQNRFKEEFGEERLRASLEAHEQLSAEKLLAAMQQEVMHFMGNSMQHDDMTAVLVKIQNKPQKKD